MRKKIVAGNWKMNLNKKEAQELFQAIDSESYGDVDVLIFPPSIHLDRFINESKGNVGIGSQNCYPGEYGAFTGEVSVAQLKDLGVKYALIGHSERRAYFGEHAEFLKQKVDKCLEMGVTPVFCIGEPLSVREADQQLEFVEKQLIESLFHLTAAQIVDCIIAYEPVWAIGTGMTASVEQAEEMHHAIRNWLSLKYDQLTANRISILYGGSCNPENANELFACPNVDGGLIGGASLKADAFKKIINSY